ncbi:hemerythrin/HHE cation-binding motif-containing protein [Gautieria morchelliformis]|nr:hemerythrin/HHE cation-binding motif-containing protein [Gautieria morchelliformis]
MQDFHTYLKYEFDELYALADGSFNSRGMSLSMFLQSATDFRRHLEAHHSIEEKYLFPILARKMPAFSDNEQHRNSHKQIHDGLDALTALIARFHSSLPSYSPTEFRACLDGFRDVLTRHLDEEVHDLQGENLRRYWTLEELSEIPI